MWNISWDIKSAHITMSRRARTIYAPNALQEEQQRLLRETFIDLLREELK
jgi:hypothetical protein